MTDTLKLHRPAQPAPCSQCPFRRKSMPGWLGADSPEGFVRNVMSEVPLPCHKSIDYRKKDWAERWAAGKIGKLCAGALIFAANVCKKPRPGSGLPEVAPDAELVFDRPQSFIDHHKSRGRGSWEMGA